MVLPEIVPLASIYGKSTISHMNIKARDERLKGHEIKRNIQVGIDDHRYIQLPRERAYVPGCSVCRQPIQYDSECFRKKLTSFSFGGGLLISIRYEVADLPGWLSLSLMSASI
jgi:hypothetical protein